MELNLNNLNTSHVFIYLSSLPHKAFSLCYLNTSHVFIYRGRE